MGRGELGCLHHFGVETHTYGEASQCLLRLQISPLSLLTRGPLIIGSKRTALEASNGVTGFLAFQQQHEGHMWAVYLIAATSAHQLECPGTRCAGLPLVAYLCFLQ